MKLRTASLLMSLVVLCFPCDSLHAGTSYTFGPEINLSNTTTPTETGLNHHPMATTPDGTLHVVWAERDSPNSQYRIYTRRLSQSVWSGAELVVDYLATDPGVPGNDIGAKYPALATKSNGDLELFWHDYRIDGIANVEIFTKTRPASGSWDPSRTADVRLTTTDHVETAGDNGYVPVPVATPDGSVHVVWYDFRHDGFLAEIYSKSKSSTGDWDLTPGDSADCRVTTDSANSELVSVASDTFGNLHAAWRSVDAGANILYATRSAGSETWSATEVVDEATLVQGAPALAVDATNTVHVVWPDGRDGGRALFTSRKSAQGSWSTDERLTRPEDSADEPSLTVDSQGTLHLVWHDRRISDFNPEIFHRIKTTGAPWDTTGSSDTQVSQDFDVFGASSTRPSVHASHGKVFVTWKEARDGNFELYFREGVHSATGAPLADRVGTELVAYPNPFRSSVRFDRPTHSTDDILVFDVSGRLVRNLVASSDGVVWDGRDRRGRVAPAGHYFVRWGSATRTLTRTQ